MKSIRFLVIITFLNAVFSQMAFAEFGPLGIGAGVLNPHMNEVQKDLNGSTKGVDLQPFVTATLPYGFLEDYSIKAQIAFGLPQSSQDQDISKSYHFANLLFNYHYSIFNFSAGPGLLFTRISGDGGTKTLRNGNTTSTFFLPSSSSLASNTTANLGVGATFEKMIAGNLLAVWTNPTVEEKRSFSLTLSITYLWDVWEYFK